MKIPKIFRKVFAFAAKLFSGTAQTLRWPLFYVFMSFC